MLVNDERKEVSPGLVPETHGFSSCQLSRFSLESQGSPKKCQNPWWWLSLWEPVRQPKLHPGKLPKKRGLEGYFPLQMNDF